MLEIKVTKFDKVYFWVKIGVDCAPLLLENFAFLDILQTRQEPSNFPENGLVGVTQFQA